MSEIPVFRIEKRDGKYVPVEAKRIAKRGSWWHLRKEDGGILRLNGGGEWRETIYEAWKYAMERQVWICCRDYRDKDANKWWESRQETNSMFCDAMEDCYENGTFVGEIEGRKAVKP